MNDAGERVGVGDDLHGFDGFGGDDLFVSRLRFERVGELGQFKRGERHDDSGRAAERRGDGGIGESDQCDLE